MALLEAVAFTSADASTPRLAVGKLQVGDWIDVKTTALAFLLTRLGVVAKASARTLLVYSPTPDTHHVLCVRSPEGVVPRAWKLIYQPEYRMVNGSRDTYRFKELAVGGNVLVHLLPQHPLLPAPEQPTAATGSFRTYVSLTAARLQYRLRVTAVENAAALVTRTA